MCPDVGSPWGEDKKAPPWISWGCFVKRNYSARAAMTSSRRGMEGTAPSRVTAMEDALELIFRISGTGMPGDPGEYI